MRPYSPSQSTNFMECPINRDLQKAGWVSNVYTYRESALYAGSAANDGMVYWYRHRNDESLTTVVDDAVEVMRFTLKKSLEVVRSLGIAWKDDVSLQLVTLPDRMEKCFRKVFVSDPIPTTWEILEYEPQWGPEYGNCRPDLVVKTDSDKIMPVDFKFKIQLDKEKRNHALAEYAYSWKQMHYAWATSKKYGCDINTHGIFLITAAPFYSKPDYFPISPELMKIWLLSAKSVWAVMAACDGDGIHLEQWMNENDGVLPTWHTFKFHTRYGLDPYGEAVLYHKLDPYLMAQSYVNTKAKGNEPGAPEGK